MKSGSTAFPLVPYLLVLSSSHISPDLSYEYALGIIDRLPNPKIIPRISPTNQRARKSEEDNTPEGPGTVFIVDRG